MKNKFKKIKRSVSQSGRGSKKLDRTEVTHINESSFWIVWKGGNNRRSHYWNPKTLYSWRFRTNSCCKEQWFIIYHSSWFMSHKNDSAYILWKSVTKKVEFTIAQSWNFSNKKFKNGPFLFVQWDSPRFQRSWIENQFKDHPDGSNCPIIPGPGDFLVGLNWSE